MKTNDVHPSLGVESLMVCLTDQWDNLELQFLTVGQHPQFASFLAQYRGISDSQPVDDSRAQLAHLVTDSIRSGLEKAILTSQSKQKSELSSEANLESHKQLQSETEEKLESLLRACEGALNLAIYFWHAPEERNFQFRTIVHFAQISSEPILISLPECPHFFMRLTEWGVQLSLQDEFEPFPFRFSLERACDLSKLTWNDNLNPMHASQTIAKLRVIQCEFCQLIDEWEHCNSILAVRQFGLRKLSAAEQPMAQRIFSEIARSRDLLACWCAGSAADLQVHITNGLLTPQLHADVRAELLATDALLLSGFQKFFLPASVSRHVYGVELIAEFLRFTEQRLLAEPEDLFGRFSKLAFSLTLKSEYSWREIMEPLEDRSFHWSLSADPSAAIKSVAWSYTPEQHQFLTASYVLAIHAKRAPNPLESFWLQTIASLAEMPASFGREQPLTDGPSLDIDELKSLNIKALECLQHFESDSREDTQTAFRYVSEFLRSEGVSRESI